MTVEELAQKVVTQFGKRSGAYEVHVIMSENGVRDEDGTLTDRILELVDSAVIRVKVKLV